MSGAHPGPALFDAPGRRAWLNRPAGAVDGWPSAALPPGGRLSHRRNPPASFIPFRLNQLSRNGCHCDILSDISRPEYGDPARTLTTKLDNNLVENAIRPSCIGKKNWLFIGHPDAGQRSAIIYSLIVSCERHGKDPLAYLKDILTRLPRMSNQDDLRPLLPANWQPAAS